MFAVGDKVVHNDYGICRIVKVGPRRFPGQETRDYYEMTPLADDGYGTTFFMAVDQGEMLREPLSRGQILEMMDAMPDIDPLKIESCGNRAQDMENVKTEYTRLMRSGDPKDWVLLLRTIYRKSRLLSAQHKRIPEFEAYARDNSERLLYGEIAGVMEIPVNRVEQFITDRIER